MVLLPPSPPLPHPLMFIILVWTQDVAIVRNSGGLLDNIEVISVLFLVRPEATPDQHVGNV